MLFVSDDVAALHRELVAGVRAARGKVPLRGLPRFTRPRQRGAAGGGFSIVDPNGNWIRIVASPDGEDRASGRAGSQAPRSRLARALEGATRLGDSKGDEEAAARTLDRALVRDGGGSASERSAALFYRAELAIRLDDLAFAQATLERIDVDALDAEGRAGLAELSEQIRCS